ncbi:hypothetical protein DUNSADRAFT_8690 [Dunaliella salina]|uniref:Encoded protein n=1 Tax=Dunaliella salina TaxID=3046 RepID=A0ABQ7GJ38_DUNSA|nr:hypothetical protein DUNSADRAFT_8690 [Dunaliella salina]|eukprot:KAF5834606.1 hypothetical protein DUNSADRAFT_8690 [Dunaliella salina]
MWLINAVNGLKEEGLGHTIIPCPWAAATANRSYLLWFACLCCPTLVFLAYKISRSCHNRCDQQPGKQAASKQPSMDDSAHKQLLHPHTPKAGHVPTSTCFCSSSPISASPASLASPTLQLKAPATTTPKPSYVLYRSSTRSEVCSAKVEAHPGLDSSQVSLAYSTAACYHLKEMERASSGTTFSSWCTSVTGCVQLLVWSTGLAEGALTRFEQWREVRRALQQQHQEQPPQQQQQQQQQAAQLPQQQEHYALPPPQPLQQLAQVPEEMEVVPEVLPFKASLDYSTAQAEKQQQQGHEGCSLTPGSFRLSDDSAMQERWSSECTSVGVRSSDDSAYHDNPFSHHVHTLLQAPLRHRIQAPSSEPWPALPYPQAPAALLPTSLPSAPPLPTSYTPSAAVPVPSTPLTNVSLLCNAICATLPELSAVPVRAQAEGKDPVIFGRLAEEGGREGGRQDEQPQHPEMQPPTPAAPPTAARLSQAALHAFSRAPASRTSLPTATPTSAGPGSENETPLASAPLAATTTVKLLSTNPCVFDSRQALLASLEVQLDLSVKSSFTSVAVRVVVFKGDGAALVDEGHELHIASSRGSRGARSSSSRSRSRGSRERGRSSTGSWGSGERGRGSGERGWSSSARGYSRSVCGEHSISLKLFVLPHQPAGIFSATVRLPSRGASTLSSEGSTTEAQRFSSPGQPLLYGNCTLLVLPRDVCQELQHGLFPRMCAAVEQEELERVGIEPSGGTSSDIIITPSPASSLTAGNLAAGTSLQPSAAPSFASNASMPAAVAGALSSTAHKAWLLHFQPFVADLDLLLRAHQTLKQQQRQQAARPESEQETLERGTRMQHPAAGIGDSSGASLTTENASVAAWADSAPHVLQFLAAELQGFVEGAGNLGAVQRLLQRLVLPS